MSRLFTTIAAVAMALVPLANSQAADKKPNPRKIISKGIKFLGGAKKLKKYKGATFSDKGIYYGMGEGLPYTGKHAVEYPDKVRMEIVGIFTTVINGNKGWNKVGGKVSELPKAAVELKQKGLYFDNLTRLYPLRGKKFKLAFDGRAKVAGKNAVIVKVESKGHRAARLFFDSETGALVKTEWKAPMERMPDKLAKFETFYSDYKTAGEIKYASKIRVLRDGKKFLEATLADYKPAESVDAKLFAKPE